MAPELAGDDSDEEAAGQTLPPDATTDIIQNAIREADRGKSRTKSLKTHTANKGIAVEEVEQAEEEGGVVLESKVALNKKKRRKARGSDGAEDTELLPVDDVEARAEEDLEIPVQDGVEMEPFNLAQEREAGRFDESGHYLANSAGRDDTDAWLTSAEGNDVSERVRQLAEQQEKERLAADDAPAMSVVQIGHFKKTIGEVLLSGETVTRGLRRLGAVTGSGKRKLGKRQKGDPKAEAAAAEAAPIEPSQIAAARADFNRLTEAASHLMDAGELDVYSLTQEDFRKASALFGANTATPAAQHDMFADDDMFADAEPQETNILEVNTEAEVLTTESPTKQSYAAQSVQQLQDFLQQRGHDATCIPSDHKELVKLAEAVSSEPLNAQVPSGYEWEPSSGYYYSKESQLFYDTTSGGYFNARDGKWYLFDPSAQQFVLNPVQPLGQ